MHGVFLIGQLKTIQKNMYTDITKYFWKYEKGI